ncbi:MAG: glycosyl hydrolase [Saprospiraceae bacterium]|nr:glycosyl hydrolase [Saprospiraceae bacterium]
MKKIRTLAIHLPQFHPIPENDRWWGKGFTEWTNVTKATPRFNGHYQPHLPADLGFYDLRLPEARAAQADLAKSYGIDGFCYYHYWFNGKKVLEKPVEAILQSGEPDFPFCLCWANENWTRRWDGLEQEVLLKQDYSEADDVAHFEYLLPFFKDQRYIRIDGKPVFLIYRTEHFPDIQATAATWRNLAAQEGFELYLIRVESFKEGITPESIGFDAAQEFQPNFKRHFKPFRPSWLIRGLRKLGLMDSVFMDNEVLDFPEFVEAALSDSPVSYKRFPCVTPMWDNSARRKTRAIIFRNASPQVYEYWFGKVMERFEPYSKEENLVFINAWNEWAEGNHLEPCQKFGKAYLEATKRVLDKTALDF